MEGTTILTNGGTPKLRNSSDADAIEKRGISGRYVSLRKRILARAQSDLQRNPYRRPLVVVLLPAFWLTIYALIDALEAHIAYSWPFVVVFAISFCYGQFARFETKNREMDTRISYVYIGIGFLVLGTIYALARPHAVNSQLSFGWALGWLYGMAATLVFRYLRELRSARHPKADT